MKGQILCYSTYEVPIIAKFIEKERMVVAKGWGAGEGKWGFIV